MATGRAPTTSGRGSDRDAASGPPGHAARAGALVALFALVVVVAVAVAVAVVVVVVVVVTVVVEAARFSLCPRRPGEPLACVPRARFGRLGPEWNEREELNGTEANGTNWLAGL